MRKGRFSEEQMVKILREADRTPVAQVAKAHGISEQTIYVWRQRFSGMSADDVRRLKQLEQENSRLKKLLAERDLEIEVMKEINANTMLAQNPLWGDYDIPPITRRANMAATKLSGFDRFVESQNDLPVWVGLDVHKKDYHVGLLRSDGAFEGFVAPADPIFLVGKLSRLSRIALVAYEAGPTGFHLSRVLDEAGMPVAVVAPSKVVRPVRSGAKTDRLDCKRLAEYASKGLLKGISVPSVQQEAERSLVRRRHDLTVGLRRIKQRIRSFLLYLNMPEPSGLANWSKAGIEALLCLKLESMAKCTLDSMIREYSYIKGERECLDLQIKSICKQDEYHLVAECLQTVPGVGPVISATFMAELFAPERFARAEEVTGYLGLAPMIRQSGEGKGRARLVPVGQKRLRSLLVEAAWVWKARDPGAAAWYGRILGRCGCAQKAIVGLARKLAIVLWRLALDKRPYEIRVTTA